MAATLKEILVHGHDSAPNPWKIIMILEELEVPYKHVSTLNHCVTLSC
jgi:glutathione S-transferase